MKLNPEEIEQIKVIDWLTTNPLVYAVTFHIPNQGKRSFQDGLILKRMGLKAGIPDIFCAYPVSPYHGLFIEMKAPKKKPTKQQEEVMRALSEQGYWVACADSASTAIFILKGYLGTLLDGEGL